MTCNAKYDRPKDGRNYSNLVEIRNYYGNSLGVSQQLNKKWDQLNSNLVTKDVIGQPFFYEATETYEASYQSIYKNKKSLQRCSALATLYHTKNG